MPLYEYRCQKCGNVFEVLQKFSDEPLSTHVGCGGEVERLLSPPALQFKGTGWYVTDYARKNGHSSPGTHSGNGGTAESKKGAESTRNATPAKTESPSKTK